MSNRLHGLDLLKIYATIMVLFLHVDGFILSQFGEEAYPMHTLSAYFFIEAFAYPAIHLFVMAGSWFMLEKSEPIKQISKVWSQTWVVTVTGLIVFLVLFKQAPGIWEVVPCVFPFLGRAYWFVTEYIILVILSPFLNKGIRALKSKELTVVTVVYGLVVCILPTLLPMFPWEQDESEMANFILLYLMTACIKMGEKKMESENQFIMRGKLKVLVGLFNVKLFWIMIWCLCVMTLTGTAIILHQIAPAHEMYFYTYNSAFVMLEALAVFMIFKSIRIENAIMGKVITWIQGGSLFVYLLHMHPVFKAKYVEWKLFKYVDISTLWIYVGDVLLTVLFMFVIGSLLGKIGGILSDILGKKIESKVKGMIKE